MRHQPICQPVVTGEFFDGFHCNRNSQADGCKYRKDIPCGAERINKIRVIIKIDKGVGQKNVCGMLSDIFQPKPHNRQVGQALISEVGNHRHDDVTKCAVYICID